MNKVVIALGSNIRPLHHLNQAVELLSRCFKVSKVTSWMRTSPLGIHDQPDFYNGLLLMQTHLDRAALNKELKRMEDQMGRDRSRPRSGPREIDMDVLIWNGKVVDPDYYDRDFLRELADELGLGEDNCRINGG